MFFAPAPSPEEVPLTTLLFVLCLSPVFAQSFADQLLVKYATQVEELAKQSDPVAQVLLAEKIYYLAHESGEQQRIADLLSQLYAQADHQEARVEISFFLIQHLRQLGQYDKVAELMQGTGYVSGWRVLGPLALGEPNLKELLSARRVKGFNREIAPVDVPSYGTTRYFAPGLGHYGFFNLDEAITPNQLVGALVTTWIQLDQPTELRLGLGWNNQLRVWINRTKLFDLKAKQTAHPDQKVLTFSLPKGWHRLSLQLESTAENPSLGFYARLTDSSGRPLPTRLDHSGGLPRKQPKLLPSPQQSLIELARAKSAYALGSIILTKDQNLLEGLESPKDLFTQALAENSASLEIVQKLHGLTTDPNQKWQILTNFLAKLPEGARLERAWANCELGQIALDQKRYWEARQYAAKALAIDPEFWPAQLLENNTLASLSLDGQALHQTLELERRHPGVPWILMDLSDLYWELDYRVEARRYTDLVVAMRRSNSKFADRGLISIKLSGDIEALDAYCARMLEDSPYTLSPLMTYTQFLITNHRVEKAEALLSQYLAILPENPTLLERMGELKLHQERREEALPYLRKALALRPQNPALEKLINLQQQGEQAFYEPFRLVAANDTIKQVAPLSLDIDNTVVKVSPNGQSSTYHQLQWEVLTDKGVSEMPGYSFSYAPLRQKAEIVRAEIQRGDRIIHMTQFGRARISDPAYRMYYDLVAYQIAFPPLEVGDKIRVEYRIDDIGNNIFGDYFGDMQYFADRYPARVVSYTLIAPKDRRFHYHVEKMTPQFVQTKDANNQYLTWTMRQVPSYETESRMPGLESYLPYVAVSTFTDWKDMGKWYADLIRDQLILDSETKDIVKRLTAGVTDRLEIVKRIHEYVVTNTRYVALEFGIHGYKPYEVNQVCSRQFGDCKDKASLIVSMLREAGVPANIAVVRTADKGSVHTSPAMLSYFNHAIAYVPEFDLYLDGTAEFSGIYELPAMDQGALTMLVDQNGFVRLTNIPISQDSRQAYALSLQVKPDGVTDVAGSVSYNGVTTPSLREYLSIDTKLSQNLQNLLKETLPGLDVAEVNRVGRTINEPITLRFSGSTSRILRKQDGQLSFPLRILGEQLTQEYAANATRQYPIDIGVPKRRSVSLTIAAPEGYSLANLPSSRTIEDANFSAELTVERADARTCKINYQVVFKTPRVEPGDYPELRRLLQEHDRLLDQSLQFVIQ